MWRSFPRSDIHFGNVFKITKIPTQAPNYCRFILLLHFAFSPHSFSFSPHCFWTGESFLISSYSYGSPIPQYSHLPTFDFSAISLLLIYVPVHLWCRIVIFSYHQSLSSFLQRTVMDVRGWETSVCERLLFSTPWGLSCYWEKDKGVGQALQ